MFLVWQLGDGMVLFGEEFLILVLKDHLDHLELKDLKVLLEDLVLLDLLVLLLQ